MRTGPCPSQAQFLSAPCKRVQEWSLMSLCSSAETVWYFSDCFLSTPSSFCPGVLANNFSSVQSLSRVQLFVPPWTAACQASLAITNSRSLPKLMSIELVMPSNHLILCRLLLLLLSIFPSIRVFSNESALRIMWPILTYWLR